jgi:hypothetical protein
LSGLTITLFLISATGGPALESLRQLNLDDVRWLEGLRTLLMLERRWWPSSGALL